VVYRAQQVALDRKVALKVLKPPANYDERAQIEFRERFAAEAKTIARLKHPHIVDVYDFGVTPMPSGAPAAWMALEWVDGETLETWLSRRRGQSPKPEPMDAAQALALLRPVLQALTFAHRQGIVHRDLKPGNIMVTSVGHERSLRVLDFGIAKIVAADEETGTGRTRTGSVPAFSPAYAAPEQVTFSRTGPRTDVHGLALILTELLTDEEPYSNPDASAYEQVMDTSRPTPQAKGRDVGPVETVLAKALALAPAARFRNAGELLEALENAVAAEVPRGHPDLHGAPTLPAPAMSAGAARPRSPRPRWRGATVRTVVTALMFLAAIGAWAAWRASRVPRDAKIPITAVPDPGRANPVGAQKTAAILAPPLPAPRGEAGSRFPAPEAAAAPIGPPANQPVHPTKNPRKNSAPRPLQKGPAEPKGPVDLFDDTK
jgi:serine/threonine-protein kinase